MAHHRKRKQEKLIMFGAVAAIILAATVLGFEQAQTRSAAKIKPPDTAVVLTRRAIDGAMVSRASSTPRLAAVVIDNLAEGYPIAGLESAALVFEAPVEGGGTTRLLAFYPEDTNASEIGPVRSLRPYFIDWAREVGAVPVHVGGSPEALSRVSNENILTLNQFFDYDFFWRAGTRARPHNVMTSGDLLRQALDAREVRAIPFESWAYRTTKSLPGTRANKIPTPVGIPTAVGINIPSFGSGWSYNAKTGNYVWDKPGASESEVRAANVVVMFTSVKVTDEMGRRAIATIGSGRSVIFTGGKKIAGTWTRKDLTARTKFLDASGQPVALAAGTTWIEVLPTDAKIESSP